ncbi:hypothetical protein [Cronobacter dublinensis]|uniref:hypothetical protein n=1 Tax=Cronobacter dublinensis TaxID=413497 RepID=UPI00300E2B19
MNKYPRVGSVSTKKKNTSAKCKCGSVAKYKTTVEVNVFRGDDEVFWACDKHKADCDFLIGIEQHQGGAK